METRSIVAKRHLQRVAGLGCIICGNAAEIHHLRDGQGMGQRASDFETIGLCPMHHRLGGYGVALHAGQATFESIYGTEAELLSQVRAALGINS